LEGKDLQGIRAAVGGNVPARIGSWLTTVGTSPASLASAGQGLGIAGTTEVAVARAVVASSGDDVVGVQGSQEALGTAIGGRDGFRVLSDAKLGDTADEAAISLVITPQAGASALEGSNEVGINTLTRISGVGRNTSSALRGRNRGDNHILAPWKLLAYDHMAPVVDRPLVTSSDGGVTAAARIRLLPCVSVPVANIADLRTNPPTPAVHEGIVAAKTRIRAGQDGWQVLNTSSGLLVTHGFRERRVLEVVLVFLGGDIVARSGRASGGGEGILVVQETSSLGNSDPTHVSGLNDKLGVANGKGRAILSNDARAGGQTSPASPGLMVDGERGARVGGNAEAVVLGSLDGNLNDTAILPLLVEGEGMTIVGILRRKRASEGRGQTTLSRLEGGDVEDGVSSRASTNTDGTGLLAELVGNTSTSILGKSLSFTNADGSGTSNVGGREGSGGDGRGSATGEGSSGLTLVIEGPHLNEVILQNERIDQGLGILKLLDRLGLGGDDQVINGTIEISALSSAVAQ